MAGSPVRRVRAELSIPLTVGGGVRTAEDAAAMLALPGDFEVTVEQQSVITGQLPARYRLTLYGPPPASALQVADGGRAPADASADAWAGPR